MVTVIVPWRPGCPHRERAWEWVRAQYARWHPGWHVVEAPAPAAGVWCKATAAHPAIRSAPSGVVVVADADVWCDRIDAAVLAVTAGAAAWAIPHRLVHRLTQAATDALIAGAAAEETCQRPYTGLEGGGIVVAHRDTLIDVPLDPRFTGWGQEDLSWAMALHTLHGPAWRGTADLIHLWHPPQDRLSRKIGSIAGQQLHRRYVKARRDPALMRALLEEATP